MRARPSVPHLSFSELLDNIGMVLPQVNLTQQNIDDARSAKKHPVQKRGASL